MTQQNNDLFVFVFAFSNDAEDEQNSVNKDIEMTLSFKVEKTKRSIYDLDSEDLGDLIDEHREYMEQKYQYVHDISSPPDLPEFWAYETYECPLNMALKIMEEWRFFFSDLYYNVWATKIESIYSDD